MYEWVWDLYGDYSTEKQSDPTGALTDSSRMARGGSWYSDEGSLRVSICFGDVSTACDNSLGFSLGRNV